MSDITLEYVKEHIMGPTDKASVGPWSVCINGYGRVFITDGDIRTSDVGTKYAKLVAGGDNAQTLTKENAEAIVALRNNASFILLMAQRIEELQNAASLMKNALVSIAEMCPVTCDMSVAHSMAAEADDALDQVQNVQGI